MRKNRSPSTAMASWVPSKLRQIDAAVAMISLSAVNDSMQIGPL